MAYELPSTYELKTLELITHENKVISLAQVYLSIKVVEDIYSNFVHGSITIEDANDLHQNAPIIGEELIRLVYTTDKNSPVIERLFRVFRLETSDDDSRERLSHTMHFTSVEAFDNANTTISKSYKNKSLSFIVSDAYKSLNTKKKLEISNFSGMYHIISPNWNPFQLINYVTSIAQPKQYSNSLALFYEDATGFKVTNIQDLLSKESLGKWTSTNTELNLNREDSKDELYPSNNIISYRILKNSTDTLKAMHEGLYSNAVIAYDNLSKSVKTYVYDYKKNFKDSVHLSGYRLNSDNFQYNSPNQRITVIPTTTFRYDSSYFKNKVGAVNVSERRELIIPSRTSLLSQISAKQIELEVVGNSSLVAGSVIDIELVNNTALDSMKNKRHRYNAKKVLITRVVNIFTKKQHKMKLIVADDSYPDELTATYEFKEIAGNA